MFLVRFTFLSLASATSFSFCDGTRKTAVNEKPQCKDNEILNCESKNATEYQWICEEKQEKKGTGTEGYKGPNVL